MSSVRDAWDGARFLASQAASWAADALGVEYAYAASRIRGAVESGRMDHAHATAQWAALQQAWKDDDEDGMIAIGDAAYQYGQEDAVNPLRESYEPEDVAIGWGEAVIEDAGDVVAGAGRAIYRGVPWWGWVAIVGGAYLLYTTQVRRG